MILPPPAAFGLPEKFREWRENQDIACAEILDSMDSDRRMLIQVCPTGFGKSITYMTAAQITEGRVAILTSTKGLQDQLMLDFGEIPGVAGIRGRGNYPCRMNTKLNCDSGICSFGVKCSFMDEGGCFYFDELRRAKKAKIVVTNYAYWMSQNEYSSGIGDFALVIMDEAHSTPDHLANHVSVEFSSRNPVERQMLNGLPKEITGWRKWASFWGSWIEDEIYMAKMERKEKRLNLLNRTARKLKRVVEIDESWVWEVGGGNVTIGPLWPGRYKELLLNGIEKTLMTSATVNEKTASLLGIDPNDVTVSEYPHSFPVKNRRITHIPTVRMNHRNSEFDERLWVMRMDQIIRERIHSKGIIHTVSYARRDLVMEKSKFREFMITHNNKNTEKTVREFKRRKAPAILVSPTMTTGWDFPDDECRFQIILKLPFPDTRGEIIKARSKGDKNFIPYLVSQQLIQTVGRGVRSKDDWCEAFILDDNVKWFMKQNKDLMVQWFIQSFGSRVAVPRMA